MQQDGDQHERSIFEAYGLAGDGQREAPPEMDGDEYSAHNLAQEEQGLAFYHEDGLISVQFYRYLQGIACPPPYRMLSLLYMDCVYLLEGRDLHLLVPKLRRHRIGEVYCLDPQRQSIPDDGPVVFHITRRTMEEMEADLRDEDAQ